MRQSLPIICFLSALCLCTSVLNVVADESKTEQSNSGQANSDKAKGIYKKIDEDGNITFTDSPLDAAEKVEIKDTNTLPAPPYVRKYPNKKVKQHAQTGYQLYISSPADKSQLTPTQKQLVVTVAMNMELNDGHYLQLLLNGNPEGSPGKSATMTSSNVRRGQQIVSVAVVDEQGKVLSVSSPITIHVIRPNPKIQN